MRVWHYLPTRFPGYCFSVTRESPRLHRGVARSGVLGSWVRSCLARPYTSTLPGHGNFNRSDPGATAAFQQFRDLKPAEFRVNRMELAGARRQKSYEIRINEGATTFHIATPYDWPVGLVVRDPDC